MNSKEKHNLLITEFLLGYHGYKPSEWREATRSPDARRLASPLKSHLLAVDRFLFSGGINVDVFEAKPEDPRQQLLDRVTRGNYVNSYLYQMWERGAATGGLLLCFSLEESDRLYRVDWYDANEFEATEDGYKIEYLAPDDYYQRWKLLPGLTVKYEPVKDTSRPWEPVEEFPNPYPFLPCVEVYNERPTGGYSGLPEFDGIALELGLEILIQTLDAASSYHYFGHPLIVSPDPEETLDALARRVQVLQGSLDPDRQRIEVLKMDAVPSDHSNYLEALKRNLHQHLGSSYVPPNSTPETSSLALKVINEASISTAERKWENYVNQGLEVFLGRILLAASFDGLYSAAFPSEPQSFQVEISRKKPFFSLSPQDKLSQLAVTQQLIGLGIDPLHAFQEFYGNLSIEEIQELMTPI